MQTRTGHVQIFIDSKPSQSWLAEQEALRQPQPSKDEVTVTERGLEVWQRWKEYEQYVSQPDRLHSWYHTHRYSTMEKLLMTTRRKHGIHQKFWSGDDTQAILSDAAAWAERESVLIHHFLLSRSKHGFVRAHAYYQTLENVSNTEIAEGIAIGMGATIHTGPAARIPATVIETTATGKTLTLQRDRVVCLENGELTFAPDPEGTRYRVRSFQYESGDADTNDNATEYVEWRVLRMGYHVELGIRYYQEEG